MKHVATEQPRSQNPLQTAAGDTFEPEIKFKSATLPEIVEMPKLSELPRWLRHPLERLKRSR
jgi:hypothetical protein